MFTEQKSKPLRLSTAKLILAAVILGIFFLTPAPIKADGMRIRPDRDRWDFSSEINQQAFINYTDGVEKMILNIGLDYSDKGDSVWLFPVPASADKVVIDIVTALPRLNGEEINKKAENTLKNARTLLLATQIYTFPLTIFTTSLGGSFSKGNDILGPVGRYLSNRDIDVYEHIEKEGLTSEIISAKNATALYNYLKSKGLNIESGAIPVLDQYIGKDFSFVVSWISSPEKILTPDFIKENLYSYINYANRFPKFSEFYNNLKQKYPNVGEIKNDYDAASYIKSPAGQEILAEIVGAIQEDPLLIKEKINTSNPYSYQITSQNQRGVFVTFPTSEIYFPLMPTSVYGSEIVPATIRVMDFVTPKIPESIKAFTKVKYYINNNSTFSDDDLEVFYGGDSSSDKINKYTKIEINAPSKFFTDDLRMTSTVPPKTYFIMFLANNSFLITIALLILGSILTSLLAGIIMFKEFRDKKGIIKLGILGLFNCFTLLIFIIRVLLLKTKDEDESAKEILIKIKQKGYFWKKRLALALLVLDAPFLFVVILISPFAIYGFVESIKDGYSHYGLIEMFGHLDMGFMFLALPVVIALIALKLKRVKNEDKPLFEELKAKNYSLWTLKPRDTRKDSFIVLFSIFFLIISWASVQLIIMSL